MAGYDLLLSPITIAGKTLRNRIGQAPMGGIPPAEFIPDIGFVIDELTGNARGGCSLIDIGECPIDSEYASRDPETADLSVGGAYFQRVNEVASAVKAAGATVTVELYHVGQNRVAAGGVMTAIGPNEWVQEDGVKNIAMDRAMMGHVAENYARAALFFKEAGLDGVNIFAGHSWLLHQFLSGMVNNRTDEYGGSLENRARFPIQVFRAVRESCGNDFIIDTRVSGEEAVSGGMSVGEVADFCAMLDREKLVDMINVSVGVYREPVLSRTFSSMFHDLACNAHLSKYIKERVSVPVAVVGGINSPELGEKLIEDGCCDIILMARQLIADPDFGRKTAEGEPDEVNHCIRCARCFAGPKEDKEDGDPFEVLFRSVCSVNPLYHRKVLAPKSLLRETPCERKKVLVVGGGVAGMQAAICAADRGHDVILAEKSGKLGGVINFADHDLHKGQIAFFKEQLKRKAARRGVNVLLNTEADAAFVVGVAPEHIICAVGAEPLSPPIPGIENAVPVLDMYENPALTGKRVVMVGGGLSGCEAALHLADSGYEVTVIEMKDKLAEEGQKLHRCMVLHLMEEKLEAYTGLRVSRIEDGLVRTSDRNGAERTFECDTVVYALGMKSKADVVETLRAAATASGIPFTAVGDCVKPQQIAQAGFDAYTAALGI